MIYIRLKNASPIFVSLREDIFRYLRDTRKCSEMVAKIPAREPSAGFDDWVLAPWSVEAVSQNFGNESIEELKRIQDQGFIEIDEILVHSQKLHLIRLKYEPDWDQLVHDPLPQELNTVSGLMNRYILSFLSEAILKRNEPVKLEEALFDLKNTVMLPDDFMPDYLMSNIEGTVRPDISYVVRRIQPYSNITSIYCYFESNGKISGSLSRLLPGSTVGGPINREAIRERLSQSFQRLGADPSYLDFEVSRTLNQLIYNLERKGIREIRRPVPRNEILARLMETGILQTHDGRIFIPDNITLEILISAKEKFKKSVYQLASKWLNDWI